MPKISLPTVAALLGLCLILSAYAQIEINQSVQIGPTEFDQCWAQIPAGYSADHPPALLIWWHQLGGTQLEMRDYSDYDALANQRGWIAASHLGPNDRHWNTAQAQNHCKVMMDWLMANGYPFSLDSIYMIGGSMGGAAGQVWNNNNCGIHDYMIAASAGASQILDCQLRQEQYLAGIAVQYPDTNRSMRAAFGGLPADCVAAAFAYHRASAIVFSDTSQSMHFNSLNLPVFNTWGHTPDESLAYGVPAGYWDALRNASGADCTLDSCSGLAGHGVAIMPQAAVVDWLSHFRRNSFPENLSINADNSDEYYWTRVQLRDTVHMFGRYGVHRDFEQRRIDITLLRNIQQIEIECQFPWPWDSLCGNWINLDSVNSPETTILLTGIPWHGVYPMSITRNGELLPIVRPTPDALSISPFVGGYYRITFAILSVPESNGPLPSDIHLVAAYPNPFNSQVTFEIESERAGIYSLHLFDVTGRLAKSLTLAVSPGTQRVQFSADGLATGIYFVRLSGSTQHPLKIVLLK